MAEQNTLRPGDTVTHADWSEGVTAKVLEVSPMPVRARYGKGRRALKPRPEDCENVAHLDKAMPAAPGSPDTDDHWMEAGLILVEQAR